MVVIGLNGEQRLDIAYSGEPEELVAIVKEGTNGWSAPKRWSIDDGQLLPGALAAEDLNGDQLVDLVLLAEKHVYLITQQPDHTFAEPRKFPLASPVKAVRPEPSDRMV